MGKFNGTVEDDMRFNENMKFTTFDHDNDAYDLGNCANWRKSGWWYNDCYTW
ncbi:hypothetical protein KR215_006709 [Drosophila sulfurigaster]|nr:hypothetical protein KR215_006709 [Drosophila sulfurigaster]